MIQKIVLWAIITFSSTVAMAQQLDRKEMKMILDSTRTRMQQHYHFKDQVPAINGFLEEQWNSGKYSSLKDREAFTQAVAADLKKAAKDNHLNFFYTPAKLVQPGSQGPQMNWGLIEEKFLNNGLNNLGVLPGDIGYMRIQAFGFMEDIAPGAFTFLQNTQALIIDLRGNGGGMPSNLVASYLLPKDSIHLISMYWNDHTDHIYTIKDLKGPRYLDKPVFLVTDKGTFSSAEEFAYDLQAMKRVTIVGEATGGGANPGGLMPVYTFKDGSKLDMYVSLAHVVNPITGKNWEGTGVQPDIACNPAEALKQAHVLALEYLEKKEERQVVKEQYQKIRREVVGRW